MKFTLESMADIKDLSTDELTKIVKTLDLSDPEILERTKTIIKDYITKKTGMVKFYETKIHDEQHISTILLKRLWNGQKDKSKELALIYKEIEENIWNNHQ